MSLAKLALVGLPLVGAAMFFAFPAFAADPEPDAAGADEDGVRFRGGISAGGGGLFLNSFSLGLGGVDGRLGVQINDLIGVYAQPQLAIYGGSIGPASGVGGIVGGSGVVDFTFLDQIFVGIGGGGALINNPSGGELHIRAGGYPVFGFGEDNIRRKGLMLGLDLRLFFVSGAVLMSPTASIGYEAF
jgi:hypothetical protein